MVFGRAPPFSSAPGKGRAAAGGRRQRSGHAASASAQRPRPWGCRRGAFARCPALCFLGSAAALPLRPPLSSSSAAAAALDGRGGLNPPEGRRRSSSRRRRCRPGCDGELLGAVVLRALLPEGSRPAPARRRVSRQSGYPFPLPGAGRCWARPAPPSRLPSLLLGGRWGEAAELWRTLRRLVPMPRRQLWQRDMGCLGVGEGGDEAGGLPRCLVWARQGRWGGLVREGDGRRLMRGLGPAGLQGSPLRRLPWGAAARVDWGQERERKRLGSLCLDSSNWWNVVERLLGFVRLMVIHLQGWLRLTVSSVLVQGCFSRSSSLERFFRSVAKMRAGGCVCAKVENHHIFWNMILWSLWVRGWDSVGIKGDCYRRSGAEWSE